MQIKRMSAFAAALAGAITVAAIGQDAPLPGQLIVTEIMNNPAAVADGNGEWFEIYNAGMNTIELAGLEFRDDGIDSFMIPTSPSIPLAAGAFFVLGRNGDTLANGGVTVDFEYGNAFPLANGDDEIVIVSDATEIDRVAYDGGPIFPDPTGASMTLDPRSFSAMANDNGLNWCEALTPYGDGDLGTPGADNDTCDTDGDGVADTIDNCVFTPNTDQGDCDGDDIGDVCDPISRPAGGCIVSNATGGDLVITEIMKNPAAVEDFDGEWFEVVNVSANPITIAGLELADDNGNFYVIPQSETTVLAAGGRLVFGRSANLAENGGAPVDVVYAGFQLGNDADAIRIRNQGALIDEVVYDNGATFPDPEGASMNLDPSATDAVSNDDGSNWCTATTPYGDGDLGTPGDANETCGPSFSSDAKPGELIVTEIMNNPAAVDDADGEYFEVANVSARTIELARLEFADLGSESFFLPTRASIPLAAGGLYVLGKSTETLTNGGATVDYAFGASMNLANGDDEVIIRNAGVVIDEVAYDGGPTFPDPDGASMNLDESAFSAADNDDGANWCEATSPYGDGDLGTPKTANDECPDCPGDFDGDGQVGFTDLTSLLGMWGPCPGCAEDLDGDGEVGFTDLTGLLGIWGPC